MQVLAVHLGQSNCLLVNLDGLSRPLLVFKGSNSIQVVVDQPRQKAHLSTTQTNLIREALAPLFLSYVFAEHAAPSVTVSDRRAQLLPPRAKPHAAQYGRLYSPPPLTKMTGGTDSVIRIKTTNLPLPLYNKPRAQLSRAKLRRTQSRNGNTPNIAETSLQLTLHCGATLHNQRDVKP